MMERAAAGRQETKLMAKRMHRIRYRSRPGALKLWMEELSVRVRKAKTRPRWQERN